MKRIIVPIALLTAALPGGAQAHAFLDHAVPAVGATVAAAPTRVQLFFTQDLEPAFTGATIATESGMAIATLLVFLVVRSRGRRQREQWKKQEREWGLPDPDDDEPPDDENVP